ncbi:MAG: hypothetical protein JWN80_2056 [Microbacteriaceae bacterium]|nr:hypothetical protein [Microbacteriaceae bacterium]
MDRIGGYRLVRKLGEGDRATVWLGHAGEESGASATPQTAALKVYREHSRVADIDREIEALSRASSAHLVELTDIATAPDGRPCLALRRIDGPPLERVLARRSSLSAGEVVTALAPVTAALAELHRVGVGHGGVSPRSIVLDQRGAPVLAGFGRARVVGSLPEDRALHSLTPAARDDEPLLCADVRDLTMLIGELLDRCPTDAGVRDLREWLDAVQPVSGALPAIADRLFDLAPATPLRVEQPAAVARVAFPSRAMTASISDDLTQPMVAAGWLDDSPMTIAQRAVRRRVGELVRTVRKPVWVAGAIGLGALVVAFAVIPSVGTARGVPPIASTLPSASATGALRSGDTDETAETAAALSGDDPVAATTALVFERASCIAERSVGCLATVEQAGSAALEADSYFLRQLQAGGTIKDRRLDGSQPTLVQRLGDSAIVGLGAQTAPGSYAASVLVVRVDAGWRIRDLTTGTSG